MRQPAEELHKPIIRTFEKRKVCSSFKNNIWGIDLGDMQLIKDFIFLSSAFDIYSKYAWVVSLKDKKKVLQVLILVLINVDKFGCKPHKIWVDKGSEFYNRSRKSWQQANGIDIYSTHNEARFVVAERFIRTLKNKIQKYMTTISRNVYIDKLDDIVNKYNKTYHNIIKMKPFDITSSTYIDFGIESNDKNPKFKVHDHVRMSKYKAFFAKCYAQNWSEEVSVI